MAQTTIPGSCIASVSGVPGGSWGGYHAPAIYEARARKRDGVLTWRMVKRPLGHFITRWGHQMWTGFRSVRKAETWCEEHLDLPFSEGIRHGTVCK